MDDFFQYVDDSVDVAPFRIYSCSSHMTRDEDEILRDKGKC